MTTALILFLVILLFSLVFADLGWSNVLSTTRNDVVFANRNKDYGAYRIRQEHHRVMVMAFGSALAFAAALAAIPHLLHRTIVEIPSPPPPDDGGIIFDIPPDEEKVIQPPVQPPPTGPDDVLDPNLVKDIVIDSSASTKFDTVQTVKLDPGLAATSAATEPTPNGPIVQTTGTSAKTTTSDPPTGMIADTQPEYPGGDRALYAYLDRETDYPEIALIGHVEGVVYVGFVVDIDGSLTDVSVLRGVSEELDAEALRVVKRMKKWKPGTYHGQPVRVRFRLPIRFEVAKG